MEDFSVVRRQYAELIRHRADSRSDRLLKALSEVPREDYSARAGSHPAVISHASARSIARPIGDWAMRLRKMVSPMCAHCGALRIVRMNHASCTVKDIASRASTLRSIHRRFRFALCRHQRRVRYLLQNSSHPTPEIARPWRSPRESPCGPSEWWRQSAREPPQLVHRQSGYRM